jgi:SAM-dependent methyltransferase
VYSAELAYIYDAGFGDFAARTAPEVIRILRAHAIPPTADSGRPAKIVEVGCGTGTLAQRLVQAGYEVVGFDISPAMIAIARAKVPAARFRVASLIDANIPRCRAVLAINEVITYVPAPDAGPALPRTLCEFFLRVHAALAKGGVFIFDFIESGRRRTYAAGSRSGRDWAFASQAELDRSGRTLTRRMVSIRNIGRQFRRSREVHVVRIYTRRAVAQALTEAGFSSRMSRSYGRHRLLPGSVAVVATKERR